MIHNLINIALAIFMAFIIVSSIITKEYAWTIGAGACIFSIGVTHLIIKYVMNGEKLEGLK